MKMKELVKEKQCIIQWKSDNRWERNNGFLNKIEKIDKVNTIESSF